VASDIVHLDTQVTEDFINGIESSNGPTRSTGTQLFLNDIFIARRDPDGQIFVVRKGMDEKAKEMLTSAEGID
jgi:hypothetical protein